MSIKNWSEWDGTSDGTIGSLTDPFGDGAPNDDAFGSFTFAMANNTHGVVITNNDDNNAASRSQWAAIGVTVSGTSVSFATDDLVTSTAYNTAQQNSSVALDSNTIFHMIISDVATAVSRVGSAWVFDINNPASANISLSGLTGGGSNTVFKRSTSQLVNFSTHSTLSARNFVQLIDWDGSDGQDGISANSAPQTIDSNARSIIAYQIDADTYMTFYGDAADSSTKARKVSLSGNTFTVGSAVSIKSSGGLWLSGNYVSARTNTDDNDNVTFVAALRDAANNKWELVSSYYDSGTLYAGEQGVNFVEAPNATFATISNANACNINALSGNDFLIITEWTDGSGNYRYYGSIATVDPTDGSITLGTQIQISNSDGAGSFYHINVRELSDGNVICVWEQGDTVFGKILVAPDAAGPGVIQEAAAILASAFSTTAANTRTRTVESSIASAFSTLIDFTVIIEADSALSSVFSQSSDANLVITTSVNLSSAFSTTTANTRTREVNISLDALFSPGIEATVTRQGQTELVTSISLSATVARTRDNDIALNNIANLSAQGDRIRVSSSALSVVSNITATALRIKQIDSSVAISFAQNSTILRIKPLNANLGSLFTPSFIAVASRNGSTDLLVSASLVAAPGNTKLFNADLNAAFAQTAITGFVKEDSATLAAQFTVNADAIEFQTKPLLFNRPHPLVQFTLSSFETDPVKRGTHSLRVDASGLVRTDKVDDFQIQSGEDFVVEGWFYRDAGIAVGIESKLFGYGETTDTLTLNNRQSFVVGFNSSANLTARFIASNLTTYQINSTSGLLSTNTWYHIAFTRQSGVVNLLLNGVSQGSVSFSGALNLPTSGNRYFHFNHRFSLDNRDIYYDDFRFARGTSAIYGLTSATSNDIYTVALWRLDNNGNDDVTGYRLDGSAALNLVSTQTAIANAVFTNNSADLNSVASLQANVGKIEANTIAVSSAFTQTVDAAKIKQFSADLNTAFTANTQSTKTASADTTLNTAFTTTVSAARTRADTADLNTAFTQTVLGGVIQPAQANFSALYSQLVVVAKISDFFVNADIQANLLATAEKITAVVAIIDSVALLEAAADAIRDSNTELDTAFTIVLAADKISGNSAVLDSAISLAGVANRTRDNSVSVNSAFGVVVDVAGGFIGLSLELSAAFDQTATLLKIKQLSSSFNAQFAQAATVIKAIKISVELNTSADLAVVPTKTTDISAEFNALYSQLSIVAKTGSVIIDLNSAASISIISTVGRDNEFLFDGRFTTSALVGVIKPAAISYASQFASLIDVIKSVTAQADFANSCDLASEPTVVRSAQIALTGAFTPSITVRATKSGEIDLFTQINIDVQADRIGGAGAELTSQFEINTINSVILGTGVNTNSAFSLTAVLSKIVTDRVVHVIPRETRSYTIHRETRAYTMPKETRAYTIQEET